MADFSARNREILQKLNVSKIVFTKGSRRLFMRLRESKSISMLDLPLTLLAGGLLCLAGIALIFISIVPNQENIEYPPVFTLLLGIVTLVGGLGILFRAANYVDRITRLWREGVLLISDVTNVKREWGKDSDGDPETTFYIDYRFDPPNGDAIFGSHAKTVAGHSTEDYGDKKLLMLYRSKHDTLLF